MDAVAAGFGSDEEEEVAGLARGGLDDAVGTDEADAHGVDQGVLGVGVSEAYFAADVGHADAVAVPGDAGDHAVEQIAVAGVVQGAETEGIK